MDAMKKWEYKIVDTKEVAGGGLLKGKSRDAIETYLQGHHLKFLRVAKRESCVA
jgi:hypothetical protein